MKLISTLCISLIVSSAAVAQTPGVGSAVEDFRRNVRQGLANTQAEMEIQVSSRTLNFPDYNAASQVFLERIKRSSKVFEEKLRGIEDFISWYESIRNTSGQNPDNRAIQRLLEKKKDELEQLREAYKGEAQKFVMLGSHLQFPVTKRFAGLTNSGVHQIFLGIVPILTPVVVVGLATGLTNTHKYKVIDMFKNQLLLVDAQISEFEGRPGPRAQEWFEKQLRIKTSEIFSQCRTQGCVYYLAEDIAFWIKKSQEAVERLEVPLKGIKPFKADQLMMFSSIQSTLDAMADAAAAGKPTAL